MKLKEMTCRFIVDKFHTRDCDGRTIKGGAHGFADGPLFERIGFVFFFIHRIHAYVLILV